MAVNKVAEMPGKSDYEKYWQSGISYRQYKQEMNEDFAADTGNHTEYIQLNRQRMYRVEKTYQPSESLDAQVQQLKHKTRWLILTEHWCGDASQTLPVFNAVAEMSEGKIEMKLVYRDQHPLLMDAYLTDNTRSIPKLIQLDVHNNVTAFWGPRPSPAQRLVKELKADPATAAGYAKALHLWYAKEKNKALELEISKLLYRANLFCPDCLS